MGNRTSSATTYCDVVPSFNHYELHKDRTPSVWSVPAAKAIVLGTHDPLCKFSTASVRIIEDILPGLIHDAYQIDLADAVQNGRVLDVGCVCLFAPHRIVRERSANGRRPTSVHIAVSTGNTELLELLVLNCQDLGTLLNLRDQASTQQQPVRCVSPGPMCR
eukprot:TRINITY_DN3762_c0_g1_i2.p1 TRINITY_DN3762_c0_g1~~TRINITY_DN3762_c0_g1_i2.p1  ORF type:complete len:162 (-),score=28.77 TRINITY_DN3762_c0_g1_i2:238-723(-)